MSKRYGLPYMGSKNKIADWVLSNLPEAGTLYDLFGGGGAVTHCAAESGKYNKIVYNELNSLVYQLFRDAISGQLVKEDRWIDRQTFNDLKDINGYISTVWSFSNNGKAYLYSKEIEPWKKAFHYAVMYEDYSYFKLMGIDDILLTGLYPHERRLELRAQIVKNKDEYKEKYIKWYAKHFFNEDIEDIDVISFKRDLEEELKNIKEELKNIKEELRNYLIDCLKQSGLKRSDIDKHLGTQMATHYFGKSQWAFPTQKEYEKIREIMPALKPYGEVIKYHDLCEAVKRLESLQSLKRLENLQSLESLERLERLESLERLERLQSLGALSKISTFNTSYDNVAISDDSVIYCDIPYNGTKEYKNCCFNYEKFYDWACSQTVPVYVSEYNIDDKRFECIAEIEKRNLYNDKNAGINIEKIYRVKK